MVHSPWGEEPFGIYSPLLNCQERSCNCPGQVSRATRGKYSFLSLLFFLFCRTKGKKNPRGMSITV